MKNMTEEPRPAGESREPRPAAAAQDARQSRAGEAAPEGILPEGQTGRKHALLGASSSHRWLRCTPSAVAETAYPDSRSDYAEEGTLAHAMGALELKRHFGMNTEDEEAEIAELSGKWLCGEMEEYVAGYAAYVLDRFRRACEAAASSGRLQPTASIEQRLDYSRWVPEGFGTGDAVIAGDGELEIIDLKYGKGVTVSAEDNPQMKLYALGAIDFFDYAYDLRTVRMTIYQPRIGNVSTWSISTAELLRWAEEELAPLAKLAAKGKGVRSSGAWCRFCRAKGDCARLAAESLDLWQLNADAGMIPAEDLPRILEQLETVSDWVKAVEERALARALAGEGIRGWKLVEGRSVRKITDPERAASLLREAGAGSDAEIYRPRELRTLTELEKTWGKKRLSELIGSCIVKPQGKPTLVPESDKRRALEPGDDFDNLLNS